MFICILRSSVIVFFLLFLSSFVVGQNLDRHRWENRVLLVFADDKSDEKMLKQNAILSKEKQGLTERKSKIYQFAKDKYATGFNAAWQISTIDKRKYLNKNDDFKVVLIGLDGGIKLKRTEILSTEKLFAIIDGMPMRRAEIKNRNK